MALIKCQECGKEISDKAPRCVIVGVLLKRKKVETDMNENISSNSNIFRKDEKKSKMVSFIICILGFFVLIFLLICAVSNENENVLRPYNGDGVLVEIFYGETCPPCQKLKEYIDTLDSDFLESVEIKYYEVWSNDENANLMKEMAKMIGAEDEAESVPFIVFNREKYFAGFDEEKFINIINSYRNK